ncbi:MAG: hypothetical protein IKE43_01370 [Coriobacteriales bacterium]|nr:hypothetical protein [Coriobacteriales bacterium]
MNKEIEVQDRVHKRHPDVTENDVLTAWHNALAARTREFGPPDIIAAAGMDSKGRLIEMLGVEMADGKVSIYHAMKLTKKMASELGL